MPLDLIDDLVNIGSGNGLVHSDPDLCRHMVSADRNELSAI